MRIVVRGSTVLVLVMLVVSCSGLLKKKAPEEDAGTPETSVVAELADAAPAPLPSALAQNEGDIARFPDETKIADELATLQRSYNVREAPPAGVVIVGLNKGTSVTKIASRDRFFLILFEDAKALGTTLMGWIHRDAFSVVIQDAGPLVCPKGEIALFGDSPICGKVCRDDKDCPSGQACKGSASKLPPNGKAGGGVTVCTIFHPHDAGAPTPDAGSHVDAGMPPVDAGKAPADAGKAIDAGPRADAGPTPSSAPAGPTSDVVAPMAGKCPANFVLVRRTNKCHRSCAIGDTQPARLKNCSNAHPFCIKCDKDEKNVCAESQHQCK